MMEECNIAKHADTQRAAAIKQGQQLEKKRPYVVLHAADVRTDYRANPSHDFDPGEQADIEPKYRQSLRDIGFSYKRAPQPIPPPDLIEAPELTNALLVLLNDWLTQVGKQDEYALLLMNSQAVLLLSEESNNLTDQLIAICDKKSLKQTDVQEITDR